MAKREPSPKTNPSLGTDLQGASRAVVDAVRAVTNIVEDMHRNIARVSPIVGKVPAGKTRGITGLVYGSVRGVTALVGAGLDAGFKRLEPLLRGRAAVPQREALLSALNGVVGDYLAASNNPLAIEMQLRQSGKPIVLQGQSGGKLLVMVHGLCMNDLQWLREGHDHGVALAQALGYTPLYLHYNTGQAIPSNGQAFAETLEQLLRDWPVPVTELSVLCHSMGGLVTRSAGHFAKSAGHQWPKRLKRIVFLGTPHLGAPLERAGSWLDYVLGVSPYSAPLARLGLVRSAGIKDLRHGRVLPAGQPAGQRAMALPPRVKCFVVAATRQAHTPQALAHQAAAATAKRLSSDGLVPVASALGQHKDAAADPASGLNIPQARRLTVFATDHFALLSSAEVAEQLLRWFAVK